MNVLLVDDDADAREYLGELIELWGHRVVRAESCAEALEAARRELPDLALVNLGLPRVSGHEVARGIRALEARRRSGPASRRSLLVALTGYGQESDRREAREAGFDEHLVKPIDAPSLQELISRAEPPEGS